MKSWACGFLDMHQMPKNQGATAIQLYSRCLWKSSEVVDLGLSSPKECQMTRMNRCTYLIDVRYWRQTIGLTLSCELKMSRVASNMGFLSKARAKMQIKSETWRVVAYSCYMREQESHREAQIYQYVNYGLFSLRYILYLHQICVEESKILELSWIETQSDEHK